MKLVTTNDETGYPTEWNCWLDAESNIVLSQKVDAANSSDVYNYYPSEELRDAAMASYGTLEG